MNPMCFGKCRSTIARTTSDAEPLRERTANSESPSSVQPHCVNVIQLVDVEHLVLQIYVDVIDEGHTGGNAVRERLAALVTVEHIAISTTDVVEVDVQLDVVEVVAELCRQLEDRDRQRAD